ncbi:MULTISPECIES: ThiF family adenylyltransferase [unclassified Variovorax]|uniref:ThiF family adenylyltransferase n=1 Tax=unclassified Variovorax TaxID=663243 RepID=UPI003F46A9EF
MTAVPRVDLAISGAHHRALQRHLYPGDGNEAVALLLCGRAMWPDRQFLLVHEVVPVPYSDCSVRTPDRVTWSPVAMTEALAKAMNMGLAVVKVHSHPGGFEDFSATDDQSDTALFESIYGWLDTQEPLASMIMLPSGRLFGRVVSPRGLGPAVHTVRVAADDFSFWGNLDIVSTPEHGRRVGQMFGDATYQRLRALRVGVVGCSGTGSIVVEQLARNGIGELVLVDPEAVEEKNLNRIINSTRRDAEVEAAKVDVLARAIAAMDLGTRVESYAMDLNSAVVIRALAGCDILMGCMDSIDGRHLLNKISSYYVIPYIDVGVRIDADGAGGVDQVTAAIHTLQPGGSSLMSRGQYDMAQLEAALMLRANPELYRTRLKEGYVRGVRVDQPAVISVNMVAAAAGVNELLARLHPYRITPNSDFAAIRISLSDPDASFREDDGAACPAFSRMVGLGDRTPLLGVMGLQ